MSGAGTLLPIEDEEVEAVLLDRPIISLTDVAYTYGRLDALYVAKRVREAEFDVPKPVPSSVETDLIEEHVLAMTPDAHTDHFDSGDSLLSVNVVLSPDPDTPPRFREHPDLIDVERADWLGMVRHGFMKRPDKAGPTYDHSLSINVNRKKADQIDSYVESRFETWPENALDNEEIMAREDAWIIEELASIAADEDDEEGSLASAVKAVEEWVDGFENKYWSGILSVKLWFDLNDGTDEPVGPFPPGLIPVCNEVGIENLRDQLVSFSNADDAVIDGVDAVTGEETTVLGTSPGRPLDYYHAKQEGAFDGFDADRSVQNQTLSLTTATAVSSGSSLIDSCREWIGGSRGSIGGFVVYYLPFVPSMDADDARDVYQMVSATHRNDGAIATLLAETIDTFAAPSNLRFHQVLVNTEIEQNKDKVIEERLGSSLMSVTSLARAHVSVLNSCSVDFDRYSWVKHDLFEAERGQAVPILTGRYLDETMHDIDREKTNPVTGANDPRIRGFAAVVTGEPLSSSLLCKSFVRRLEQDQRDLVGSTGNGQKAGPSPLDQFVPSGTIVAQYIEYNALMEAGLITDSEREDAPYPIMTNEAHTDGGVEQVGEEPDRDTKLERFLQNHELLSNGENGNEPMRASFLLGGIVGRVSQHQLNEGVASPIARRWMIDSVNRANFRQIFADVAAKNDEYAFAHNNGFPLNQRYIRRLRGILADSDPREWPISEDALRTAYALGLSYGRDDKSSGNSEQEDSDNSDEEV